jgi:hypothetical protein
VSAAALAATCYNVVVGAGTVVVVVALGGEVSIRSATPACPQALTVPTLTSYVVPGTSPVKVAEVVDNGSLIETMPPPVPESTVASGATHTSYDDGNAEVADLFINHATLIVVSVALSDVIKGARMGVVLFPDSNFV